jgi:hypothetical protein
MTSLQANLAAMTSMGGYMVSPHHPISCMNGGLAYHEDGSFECDHAEVPPDDQRTQAALDSTVAILLFEELAKRP